ncbi:2'-5' RNA ligase family protein [Hymenobacter aerilatus]|uniref:2'-5' RNA ligase family protein n=1 Tax=Hymenobacter aerilatus TaxID=2932251 RepID=A0A8T9SVU5_9BACT|nr:2'-5' RNA ligase family protein [Hymenobacter aerilatus]UOR06188.1 2'-5' RNA ligase family protein [Hymenobacter aerilatus]
MDAPLILTLTLDADAQQFFNRLREEHFPPERNYLAAHLTLFHHLPSEQRETIMRELATRARHLTALTLSVTGVQFLGRGVAYSLESPALQALHQELQQQWWPYLTPQDQQRRRPHVTIQNKVDPKVARALHEELSTSFQPFEAQGKGMHLWAYRGGPWESVRQFVFLG